MASMLVRFIGDTQSVGHRKKLFHSVTKQLFHDLGHHARFAERSDLDAF
jgi:hypothetical protein